MNSPAVIDGRADYARPSAMASPQASGVYRVGQVLKELVHKAGAFHSENDVLGALDAIDSFISAFVPAAAVRALVTGVERAPIEDVSKRIPPNGSTLPAHSPAGSAIDYDKLAAAIVRHMEVANAPAITATVTDLPPAPVTSENTDGAASE